MARVRMKTRPAKERPLLNIGALLDLPTASFKVGARGETIINGGVDTSTGLVGPGNSFKSAIMLYMMLSSANTIAASHDPYLHLYDTENNVKKARINSLSKRFEYLPENITEVDFDITNKSEHMGDEWNVILRDFVKEAQKEKPVKWESFLESEKIFEDHIPTFVAVDSFSEFEPNVTAEMIAKSKKEDGSLNTLFLQQGKFKTHFLSEIPGLAAKSNLRFFTTAHLGKAIEMDANKYSKPTKVLSELKDGESIKGVSGKFFFLISTVWATGRATSLVNPSTKEPEYPAPGMASSLRSDLKIVWLKTLRCKSGTTGIEIPIIVSQNEGVLPSLSEFHYIKSNDRFGIVGSNLSYSLVLYPDVKLGRTTIRKKIDNDHKLRRALNITAELLQLKIFHPSIVAMGLWLEPEQLYNAIIDRGYDWDEILDNTRGWYTIDNYKEDLPNFLSIMDLLKIANSSYTPYWAKKKKQEKK